MNKFITTDLGGLPHTLDDIRWYLGQNTTPAGVYQAIESFLLAFGTDFIVQGCTESGGTIAEGWVFLDSELVKVDSHTWLNNGYFVKNSTWDATGSKTFQDSSTNDTYQKNRAAATAVSGTLVYTGDRLEDVMGAKITGTSYTEQNYITDGDLLKKSIDDLDIQVKDNADDLVTEAAKALQSSQESPTNTSFSSTETDMIKVTPDATKSSTGRFVTFNCIVNHVSRGSVGEAEFNLYNDGVKAKTQQATMFVDNRNTSYTMTAYISYTNNTEIKITAQMLAASAITPVLDDQQLTAFAINATV